MACIAMYRRSYVCVKYEGIYECVGWEGNNVYNQEGHVLLGRTQLVCGCVRACGVCAW